MKAICAFLSGRSRTVTKASVPSVRAIRKTPASAPKVVSGCCGPRMASKLAVSVVISGARAWMSPSSLARSAVRSSWVAPLGRLAASAPCQLLSGFSGSSLRRTAVKSAISARRSSAKRECRLPRLKGLADEADGGKRSEDGNKNRNRAPQQLGSGQMAASALADPLPDRRRDCE